MTVDLQSLDLDVGKIDEQRMYRYRLDRVQAELRSRDIDALITRDPVNTRYATGIRNMQVWAYHSVIRMAVIPAHGNVVVFEYGGSEHLADGLDTIVEVRPSVPLHFGPGHSASQNRCRLQKWVAAIQQILKQYCDDGNRVALDNLVPYIAGAALKDAGLEVLNGYAIMGLAQSVKNEDEIRAMQRSIDVAEIGIQRLQQRIVPGVTENQLWAVLNHANIEFGGEYMDTRLLSSGPRTNPWYQESSDRRIERGDMIALDTDMIGPYGYDADISRSFVCDIESATARQREVYRIAYDHVHYNIELLKPGTSFRQLSEQAFQVPKKYQQQTIAMNWHGVSLYGGWPTILGRGFFDATSEDGEVVPGMTLCVESYVGEAGGPDGVKLERQVLITQTGYRLMDQYPFEEALLTPHH